MNPLVKKEIRLLLPSFLLGLLLAFSVWLIPAKPIPDIWLGLYALPFLCCPVVLVLMMLESFGHEMSAGTFSSLLAQPVPRTRVWRTKTLLLAAAALIIWLVWCGSAYLHDPHRLKPADFQVIFLGFGLFILAAYTGGLWTVLLLRQVAAAFWFTILLPALLLVTLAYLLDHYPDNVHFNVVAGVFIVYSIAGFLLARRLFLRAQDVAWTGGVISLANWRYFDAASRPSVQTRQHRPVVALLRKEFRLHGISLFFALVLLALHLGVILYRNFGYAYFARNPASSIISECFWVLWLFLPVIIGGTAMAEERKLGVMDGQLCLPASRRVQFLVKFLLALSLGVLLGSVPLLVEGIACRFGVKISLFKVAANDLYYNLPCLLVPAGALGLSLAAFFASSLARNFLQALSLTIATITVCVLNVHYFTDKSLASVCHPLLLILLTLLVIPPVSAWLAYLNFKNYLAGWHLWRRNLLGLAGAMAFVVVAGAALYHRAWEVFEPAEPAHGPAKFTLANPPTLRCERYYNLLVRLPDGRVWFDRLRNNIYETWSLWQVLLVPLPESGGPQRFISGSNWVSATVGYVDTWVSKDSSDANRIHVSGYLPTVGIQSDGSLWFSDQPDPQTWPGDRLVRFGDDTNWRQVVQRHLIRSVVLLKKDGTLWRWGTPTPYNWKQWPPQDWPDLRKVQPQQIGTDSDWKEIFPAGDALARKSDGSVWFINAKDGKDQLNRATNFDRIVPQSLSRADDDFMAYVKPDGSLWTCKLNWHKDGPQGAGYRQIGDETNWVAVATSWRMMMALKSDGSLWEWNPPRKEYLNFDEVIRMQPVRVGIHDDWVAVTGTWGNVIAMAADGSLWLWPDRNCYEPYTLLKLPRQPQLLGNVFGKAD
jgi:ABC-type transport system involved in multi-copper enzyme maturation permease subunit